MDYKRVFKASFIVLLLIFLGYLIYTEYQITPPKYFYLFLVLVMLFIGIWVVTLRFVNRWYKDNKSYIPKLIDLAFGIILGLLVYLFAIYIHPR
jgi:hypothetical protein